MLGGKSRNLLRLASSSPSNLSTWSSDAALQRLSAVLGKDSVSAGDSVRVTHGQDQSCYPHHAPDIVVFPNSTAKVGAGFTNTLFYRINKKTILQ